MNTPCLIRGMGHAVPDTVLTNADLERLVDTNDEWITSRTGIKERRVATKGETCVDLCLTASQKALEHAGMQAAELTHVLVATFSADAVIPSAACQLSHRLGIHGRMSMDLSAACSGFLYAVETARALLSLHPGARILVAAADMLEIDRFVLIKFNKLARRIIEAYTAFDFHLIYHSLHNFCTVTLSAFYLDILKDRLYTSRKDAHERRSSQTAMYLITDTLTRLLAPLISFTADEIWQFLPGEREASVHLSAFPKPAPEYKDAGLAGTWARVVDVRADVLKALELKRVEKVIGHPLDAAVRLSAPAATVAFMNDYLDKLRAICIVSRLDLAEELSGDAYDGTVVEGLKVLVEKAPGEKCERCWCYSEELGSDAAHPTICPKCTAAVV